MGTERRKSKDLFKQFIKLLKTIDLEGIAEKTKVDEFSKKLGLKEHLLIILWYVIGDCITLTELSDSLKGGSTREIPSDRDQQITTIESE